jgi:hypothetical protein
MSISTSNAPHETVAADMGKLVETLLSMMTRWQWEIKEKAWICYNYFRHKNVNYTTHKSINRNVCWVLMWQEKNKCKSEVVTAVTKFQQLSVGPRSLVGLRAVGCTSLPRTPLRLPLELCHSYVQTSSLSSSLIWFDQYKSWHNTKHL